MAGWFPTGCACKRDGKEGLRMGATFVRDLTELAQISEDERRRLEPVTRRYAFAANRYYLSLVNWADPDDPIRRIVVPDEGELQPWGRLDPSEEAAYTVMPGLEHKYPDTVLMLVSRLCGGVCRFCFRKRLFLKDEEEEEDILDDVDGAVRYIASRKEVTDVLLSGGDPLMLPPSRLERLISAVASVPHVRTIRVGSKVPAYMPARLAPGSGIVDVLARHSPPGRRIYLACHFSHPRELSPQAHRALRALREAGVVLVNQTPLLRGVNDDPLVLSTLLKELSAHGVAPYYVFQCRPASGNLPYVLPLETAYSIFRRAVSRCSGLSARVRFVMSHATGKVEVVGLAGGTLVVRYHRSPDPRRTGAVLLLPRNPAAFWLDDYPTPESPRGALVGAAPR